MPKAPTKSNLLCVSCRRTCKQAQNAVVAKCPRYYPFSSTTRKVEFTWKQIELPLAPADGPHESPAKGPAKPDQKRKPTK
ncbi:hypothetical protein F6V30_14290 [Oryzomonas sagensis]|uniref:Uncharacterized protein n=1 Tax=Oryzomonas sagensis TaxID=2603857 RepID=A0ABQ6TL60_9BACT|nr:hypothetical protein F6V30_14290 [Oryzomonas sagensis]